MINSISSGMSMPPPPKGDQKLTQDQQTLITDTLAKFDVDNLSEEDARSIVETFSEAGIRRGQELEQAVADAGFDAKNIGELAIVSEKGQRPPPPPPSQSSDEISTLVDYLAELVEETLANNNGDSLSTEDKESIMAQVFEEFRIEQRESIIKTSV